MSKSAIVGCPSDATDDEWEFVLPYLLLRRGDSPQRKHDLWRVFNGMRYAAQTAWQWRYLPHGYGSWWMLYQQTRRWLDAGFGCLRGAGRQCAVDCVRVSRAKDQPTAVCIDSCTLPASGACRLRWAKRRKGSKVHIAVDTLANFWR